MMPANLNDTKKSIDDLKAFSVRTFEHANEFKTTALVLYSDVKLFRQSSFSVATNAAFACELYLKSIIAALQYKKSHGHYLDELFSEIGDEEIKLRIKNATQRDDFDSVLKNISKAFYIVRYANEYTGMTIEVEFLLRLMIELQKECAKLCKSSREQIERNEEENK